MRLLEASSVLAILQLTPNNNKRSTKNSIQFKSWVPILGCSYKLESCSFPQKNIICSRSVFKPGVFFGLEERDMQREREVRDEASSSNALGGLGEKISSIFGRSGSFGSFFGSKRPVPKETRPDDLPRASKPNGPVIEELDTDDDDEVEKCGDDKQRRSRSSDWTNRNPLVEHPEDQAADHNKTNNTMRKNSSFGSIEGTRSVSYTRVTYGGINGAYLTASTSRLSGSDGRVWEETRHADTTTGEATHRISRGIHDKGHTVTRKLKSDGKVDALETLHNLEKDDLVGFEQDWKQNADKHMPRWNDGLDFHPERALKFDANNNRGTPINSFLTKWDLPFRPDLDVMAHPSGGRPKKVVRINIE